MRIHKQEVKTVSKPTILSPLRTRTTQGVSRGQTELGNSEKSEKEEDERWVYCRVLSRSDRVTSYFLQLCVSCLFQRRLWRARF